MLSAIPRLCGSQLRTVAAKSKQLVTAAATTQHKYTPSRHTAEHTACRLYSGSQPGGSFSRKKTSLVIFDKDGTLIEYGVGYVEWTQKLTHGLEAETGLVLGEKILHLFGYDTVNKRWREGLMCDNPLLIMSTLSELLQSEGVSKHDADHLMHHKFVYDHMAHPDHVTPLGDPLAVFRTLKHYGIHTAICTSDSKYSCGVCVDVLRLAPYCDFTFSGDDDGFVSKPRPDNIYRICEAVGLGGGPGGLDGVVMVGDSRRDIEMGRAAGVGLVVGVTSGVCDSGELSPGADIIAADVGRSLEFYLPEGWEEVYQGMCEK